MSAASLAARLADDVEDADTICDAMALLALRWPRLDADARRLVALALVVAIDVACPPTEGGRH